LLACGAACIAAALFAVGRPASWIRQLIGTSGRSGITVLLEANEPLPPNVVRIVAGRLPQFNIAVNSSTANAIAIEVVGAKASDADAVIAALNIPGRLAFAMSVDNSNTGRHAAFLAERDLDSEPCQAVDTAIDDWESEGKPHLFDRYLLVRHDNLGFATNAIAKCIEAAKVSNDEASQENLRLVLERVTPRPEVKDKRPFYRSYFVAADDALTQRDVVRSSVRFSDYSQRPEVWLSFTRQGAQIFGELTSANVGHKLAIIRDGVVISAPIISGPIRGGQVSITMGGGNAQQAQRDAEALAAALRGGEPLPSSVRATLVDVQSESLLLGIVPWLLAALFAVAVLFARAPLRKRWPLQPTQRSSKHADPISLRFVLVATAVTAGIPAILWFASSSEYLILPSTESLLALGSTRNINVLMLGIGPAIVAYTLVEVVAWIVPSLRSKRIGIALHRRNIDRAVLIVTLLIAALQSYFIATYLASLSDFLPSPPNKIIVMATLTAGSLVYPLAANFITRYGLCNGWLVLVVLRSLSPLWSWAKEVGSYDHGWQALCIVPGLALMTLAITRTSFEGRRLPRVGMTVISIAMFALVVLGLAALSNSLTITSWAQWLQTRPVWIDLLLAAAASFAFLHRRNGWLLEMCWYIAIAGIGWLSAGYADVMTLSTIVSMTIMVVTVGSSAWGRIGLGHRVLFVELHDPDHADRWADAFRVAGVSVHIENQSLRAMFRGLAAYSPIAMWIPLQQIAVANSVAPPPLPQDLPLATQR
jgi:hypothetical protein